MIVLWKLKKQRVGGRNGSGKAKMTTCTVLNKEGGEQPRKTPNSLEFPPVYCAHTLTHIPITTLSAHTDKSEPSFLISVCSMQQCYLYVQETK